MSKWQSWYEAYRQTKQDEVNIVFKVDWFDLVTSIVIGAWLLKGLGVI